MILDVTFSESTTQIPVDIQGIHIITNGVPPEEVEKLVADAEAKGNAEGIATGRQAAYDVFWDVYQQNGNRADYKFAFAGEGWTDSTFRPKYDMQPTTYGGAESIFEGSLISDVRPETIGVNIDFSKIKNANYMLQGLKTTKYVGVVDIRNTEYGSYLACNSSGLKSIEKLILSEKDPGYSFGNLGFSDCTSLEHIIIEGTIWRNVSFQWSPLSAESVQSIVDHLKDRSGLATQTLTLKADVGANLTEAQRATITAKNWTLVY